MTILKLIISYILIVPQIFLTMLQGWLIPNPNAKFEKWDASQPFTREYAYEIEKEPGKDFVVLNFTDIQIGSNELAGKEGDLLVDLINTVVKETQPDLITVTGDNAGDFLSYIQLGKIIDKLGIPWAPVMGNHDGQDVPWEQWCARSLTRNKNCLFKMGPKDMGFGNYIINVTENGKIIHTLFMMDTHSSAAQDGFNGTVENHGYDHFWANQFDWYKWAVKGIAAINGSVVESSVFMHIPVYEYRTAWAECYDKENDCYKDGYKETCFGKNREGVCAPEINNGFFALCKELGSTKNMVVGHDHTNYSSILYDGIRLSYGLKSSTGSYWDEDVMGGTTLSINSEGNAEIEHHFFDISEYIK